MTERTEVYSQLEAQMLGYEDYSDIPVELRPEVLVPINDGELMLGSNIRDDARLVTGDRAYVRQGVLTRLVEAGQYLQEVAPTFQLDIGYGYRALSVQQARYEAQKAALAGQYEGVALEAAVHRQVAVPTVAGHPAGAAVDIQIVQAGEPLAFGTKMWEFVDDSYTFSPFIGAGAIRNRMLLREVMLSAGFAPFDGEWWHFSYGDREWARYYNRTAAMYEQIEFRAPGTADV